ncbi:carbamoyl-phosphate synthase small subunit [Saccharophagus sp. K07]|jgi:cell division protein FtsN|uniref:SPOR domain-containing protein n=1 Tax=Saccharophagus sp. K07 TaxID=2283636 RepID=UPI001651E562|nr:SPOR domain-containing protein [Saccharophagus sp. K07]MBC6905842.1 carbamoyl-phosphate synthase small subunit [Saccharophagus sp. K07]
MANQSSSSKVPGWVWLFTGTILGAFITFLMRLSDLQPAAPTARQNPPPPAAATEEKKAPPKYDFYKMLRDTEVPVTAKPKTTSTTPKKAEENVEYLLQVASFRSAADAEQVRAELTLLNLNARIEQSAASEGNTWHRVIVGPFANRSQMSKAKDILLSNRYDAMLLTRKRGG